MIRSFFSTILPLGKRTSNSHPGETHSKAQMVKENSGISRQVEADESLEEPRLSIGSESNFLHHEDEDVEGGKNFIPPPRRTLRISPLFKTRCSSWKEKLLSGSQVLAKRKWVAVGATVLVLLLTVGTALFFTFCSSPGWTTRSNEGRNKDMKQVSRFSWNQLNKNERVEEGDSVILPSKMVYSSSMIPGGGEKARSCCRTQKYSQVVKRNGCESAMIVNRMCFGQCVSVWVPGLFASFPVCRPSKSNWKTVTLVCGSKKKRVKIEKVRRCSCMEIEPTNTSKL